VRFISQYGEYGVQIRPQRGRGMGDGSFQVTQEPLYAKFDHDELVFEVEIERAMKEFGFRGQYQHVDEATPVDPSYRLSVFDSIKQQEKHGWTDEEREIIERELLRKEKITNDFFASTQAPISAPFPKWDDDSIPAYKLVAMLVEMGGDLQLALDYERLFGHRREGVIEALQETMATEAPAEFVSA
jgi:hypothetical protein